MIFGRYLNIWHTRTIPYKLAPEYDQEDRKKIKMAMEVISKNSCVNFQELPAHDTSHHVQIFSGAGCYSNVGHLRILGYQNISLERPSCLAEMGYILHELFHALGFHHEFQRPDRDRYVNIMWENIIELTPSNGSAKHNFIRTYTTNAETFGIEYDYKSIMHYSPYSGSKDPTKMTIVPTDPALTAADVGNGDKPTEKDFMKLNLLYECENKAFPISQWTSYGPCLENDLDGVFERIRQRFCSHENISECGPRYNNRVETEFALCDEAEYVVDADSEYTIWSKWSTWTACGNVTGQIYIEQTRKRRCPESGRCVGSNSQLRSCRTDSPIRDSGYYMKAENLNNATEKHQAVLSVKINKGNKGETCLTFWYYMTRSVNHALKVRIERAGIAATATKIVSKFHKSKSNKTDNCNVEDVITTLQADIDWWLPAEADFDCGESPYQVSFIASNGGDKYSNIAIDDVFFLVGKCRRDL